MRKYFGSVTLEPRSIQSAYYHKTFIYTHIPSKRKFACCITLCVRAEDSVSNLFGCVHLHVLFDRIMLEYIETLRLHLKKHSYLLFQNMFRPKCHIYLGNCYTKLTRISMEYLHMLFITSFI